MVWHVSAELAKGIRAQWAAAWCAEEEESVLLIARCASGWKLRRWAGRFARQSGRRLAVARLPALVDDFWTESDRRINRLFSTPANREAVILIHDADGFVAAADDPRYAYLRSRIEAHRGTVILGVRQPVTDTRLLSALAAREIELD